MSISAVCFLFLIKLRWPKNTRIYELEKLNKKNLCCCVGGEYYKIIWFYQLDY